MFSLKKYTLKSAETIIFVLKLFIEDRKFSNLFEKGIKIANIW